MEWSCGVRELARPHGTPVFPLRRRQVNAGSGRSASLFGNVRGLLRSQVQPELALLRAVRDVATGSIFPRERVGQARSGGFDTAHLSFAGLQRQPRNLTDPSGVVATSASNQFAKLLECAESHATPYAANVVFGDPALLIERLG